MQAHIQWLSWSCCREGACASNSLARLANDLAIDPLFMDHNVDNLCLRGQGEVETASKTGARQLQTCVLDATHFSSTTETHAISLNAPAVERAHAARCATAVNANASTSSD